jgi:uncharacterized membrane protein YhaH (DUF805 family)
MSRPWAQFDEEHGMAWCIFFLVSTILGAVLGYIFGKVDNVPLYLLVVGIPWWAVLVKRCFEKL